jgi:hypothetical protein
MRLQARDHRDVDGIRPGDLSQGLAGLAALDRLGALVFRQLRLAAELLHRFLGVSAWLGAESGINQNSFAQSEHYRQ